MLKKVHIKNFLSCQDTEIEFDNITALIGRNAAGKTNILKAIEECAHFAIDNKPNDFLYTGKKFYTSISIEFFIENNIYKYKRCNEEKEDFYFFIEELSYKINNQWDLIAERKNNELKHYNVKVIELQVNPDTPMISSMLVFLSQNILNPSVKVISKYLSEIKYYSLDNNQSENTSYFIFDEAYKEWTKSNKEKSSVLMRLIHIWNENKELFNELQELIGINGLNIVNSISVVKTNFPTLGQSNSEIIYLVRFNVANTKVSYIQLSYGTQRVLAILLALLYDKNSTLLIEQPEDGIHSGLLRKLLPICFQYAKYYNKQLIIATHSPEVINLFQPENIRLVKMTEQGTKVSALDKERIPFIREYMEEKGALFDFIESMDDE